MKNSDSNLFRQLVRPTPLFQWTAITSQLLILTIMHNSIYIVSHPFHMMVVQKLFFVPVILAGFWTNAKGGLLVALFAAILYPHRGEMGGHQNHMDHQMFMAGQSSDIVLLFIVGGMMGLLRNLLEQEAEKHLLTAKERDEALSEALENFKAVSQKDRLAALGQMVAGIAHEIGNPLTSMLCSIEVLKRSVGKDPKRDTEILNVLEREINRLDEIVRRFLDYATPGKPALQRLEAGILVKEAVGFMRLQIEKSGLKLSVREENKVVPIKCDPAQINQIIVNLLLNACQFANKDSEIEVLSSTEAEMWKLEIQNEGCPIPENMHEKIFEPFVTTRTDGSGLGLAVAHRISRSHGGSLSCVSGEKTKFIMRLPMESL